MEHLKAKWTVGTDDDGFKCIVTDEAEPWYVVQGIPCLPGDENGIETLWYICRLHNESLTPNAPDQRAANSGRYVGLRAINGPWTRCGSERAVRGALATVLWNHAVKNYVKHCRN